MRTNEIASVALAVLLVAALSVAVRPGSQTGSVLGSGGNAAASIINAAKG